MTCHELIEGSIVEKDAATGEHGAVQRKLFVYIGPYDQRPGGRRPGGCWVATEVDVYFDERNTFRPDVVGWRRDRVPERPRGILVMAP
ncbi:Uma2 family endonuclease [Sorangium sp. So ce1335]|uniref:Uma2 family endonuclease n=1 Tax=Sorangium sp. So ce1335 TaxID=3133335 RepID=UPI003F5F4B26